MSSKSVNSWKKHFLKSVTSPTFPGLCGSVQSVTEKGKISEKSNTLQQMDTLLWQYVLPKITLRHKSKAVRESCLPADKQKLSFTTANASHFLDMNIKDIGIYWLVWINTTCAAVLNMSAVHRVGQFYLFVQYNVLAIYKIHAATIPIYNSMHNLLQ